MIDDPRFDDPEAKLTDREWSMRADRHALQAMATAGDVLDQYNKIVIDFQTLMSLYKKQKARVDELEELLTALANQVLG